VVLNCNTFNANSNTFEKRNKTPHQELPRVTFRNRHGIRGAERRWITMAVHFHARCGLLPTGDHAVRPRNVSDFMPAHNHHDAPKHSSTQPPSGTDPTGHTSATDPVPAGYQKVETRD